MDAQKRYRIPGTAIALDLVGCLMIALGALELSGILAHGVEPRVERALGSGLHRGIERREHDEARAL